LKVIGSVGEPINEEAWHWYNDHVGAKRCPVVDTWWQTETGGIMISPIAFNTNKANVCYTATTRYSSGFDGWMKNEMKEIK
jgi:acyl-coenzyme A synthetase/AMP-(fatty) acid ligase